jgi:hypothetical protein
MKRLKDTFITGKAFQKYIGMQSIPGAECKFHQQMPFQPFGVISTQCIRTGKTTGLLGPKTEQK